MGDGCGCGSLGSGTGRNFLLENWTTVRSSVSTVVQAREQWLSIPTYADATFWIDVANVSPPAGGLVGMLFETAPSCDESLFRPVGGTVPLVASTSPTIVKSVRASSSAPLSCFLRWKLAATTGGTWDATFRIRVVGNRSSYFVPTQLSGCVLWVRGDLGVTISGTSVTAWADQSGSGNDLTASANNFPTYSRSGAINAVNPSITFAASPYFTAPGALWTGNAARTLIVVYKPAQAISNMGVAGQSGTQTANQWFEIQSNSGADPALNLSTNVINGPTPDQAAKWAMATYDGNTTNVLYENGSSAGTGNFTLSTNNVAFRVGGDVDGNGTSIDPFTGDIGEVLAFNRVLSATEIQQLTAYVHAYWGL